MNRVVKFVLPLLVIGLGAFALWALVKTRPEVETRPSEVPVPLIRVAEVEKNDLKLTVRSQGTVSPRTASRIVAEVSGRVERVSPAFVSGGYFEKGDVLLEIDPFDYREAVIGARARVAQAQVALSLEEAEARVAAEEWADLGEGEAQPLTLRVPQLEQARASVAAAEADLRRAERELERTVVRAPYAGRVRDKMVDLGQYVTRGAAVADVYSVDFAEIRLPIPNADLAYIDIPFQFRGDKTAEAGPPVTVRATFAGRTFEWSGRIDRTEGEIDPKSRMVHVIARVRDPYGRSTEQARPALAVGMYVEAEIEGNTVEDVTILPREVLRGDDVVLIVDDDDRLRFRTVEVMRADRDRVVVRGGLVDGERVCLSPLEAVTEGMQVRVSPAPAEDAA